MKTTTGRRQFLAGTAAAVAARTLRAEPAAELRAALVGVGARGSSLLRQVLEQDGVKVAAICDTDPEARDKGLSAASRDNPGSYADYRKILERKDLDAVFIATPCDLHAEMAAACMQAGKYVYCEKPLGVTPEQVDMALKTARRSRTWVQIGQQLRYMPGVREAVRQVQDVKILGRPFVIKAQRHSTPPMAGQERQRPAWYLDVKRSGNLIVENSVHNLDVCNWVANSHPVIAFGHGKKYLPPPPVSATQAMMDGFSVMYVYENDMHLDYSQLYLHPRNLKVLANAQWYMIFGEKGTLDLSKGLFYEMHATGEPREVVPAALRDDRENAVSDFFACIREGRKPFADITVAATAALTAILGREAIYRGRSVTWKELGVEV